MASQDSSNGRNLATRPQQQTALAQPSEMPAVLAAIKQFRPEIAERAFTIMLSRPVDQYTPMISPERALGAALFEEQTGQVCGRDFYVDEKMGNVPGYRGLQHEAAERGARDYMDDYRAFTPDENEDHEIKPGDTASVCLLTVPGKARACREAGIPYRPTVGYGIVKAHEKKDRSGNPIQLKGGYTWKRKANNRALKDALRHAGFASTAAEIFEDAEREGVDVEGTFGLLGEVKDRLSVADAEYVVEHSRGAAAAEREQRTKTPEELRAALNRNVETLRRPADFKGYGDEPEDHAPTTPPAAELVADEPDEAIENPELAQVNNQLAALVGYAASKGTHKPTDKARDWGLGCLRLLFGSDEAAKIAFLRAAFGRENAADLTAGEVSAIMEFIKPEQIEGQWAPSSLSVTFLSLFRKHVMGQAGLFED